MWYTVHHPELIDSPALLVYSDRVRQNIRTAIHMVGDPSRLRPHIKTHKTREVIEMLQDAGVNQFKCATIAEAELLGLTNAKDVLLAYQPVGPKLQRFIHLIQAYPSTLYSCLVDNPVAADSISEAALAASLIIPVYIDLNVGMNRTGISPEAALELAKHCRELTGIRLEGLHMYDGHLRNPDLEQRTTECNRGFEKAEQLQRLVEALYQHPMQVIAGGSPSFPIHAARKSVQCSPGTFVYWDAGYQSALAEQDFVPAALILARIISLPAPGLICIDLGHKSVAAENPIDQRILFLNAPEDWRAISQSEEHLVIKTDAGHSFRPGDILYGLPYHICPSCALYERAITIRNGEISGEWKIAARDRKINY